MLRNIEKRVPAGFRQENKKSFRVYLTQAEGPVLGVGANMFKVAGPVLVCGIAAGTVVGIIYWLIEKF